MLERNKDLRTMILYSVEDHGNWKGFCVKSNCGMFGDSKNLEPRTDIKSILGLLVNRMGF